MGKGRYQPVDEGLCPLWVVGMRRERPAAFIGGAISGERLVVTRALIERTSQRVPQIGPFQRAKIGAGDCAPKPLDQRVCGAIEHRHFGEAHQRKRAPGFEFQRLRINRARPVAVTRILVQIAEIEQGRDIAGPDCERRFERRLRCGGIAEVIGENDRTVEMDLFGSGYLAFQGTVISGQGFAKGPLPFEQQAEVHPVIGSIRIKREQVPIGFARLIIARRAI